MNEQDMKVFGGSEGFHVLFLLPGNRKELSCRQQILPVLEVHSAFV